MRSILVHIAGDDFLSARLHVALDLARSTGGHVTCLQAIPYEMGIPGDLGGFVGAQLMPAMHEAADSLRERVQRDLAGEDVSWSWIQEDGMPESRLIRAAGLADVIVLGSDEQGRGASSGFAGAVAIRARAPVLLVPPEARNFDPRGLAFVAWDGSPEACHALRAALPLLANSRDVVLATVVGEGVEEGFDTPLTEGAEYLSRHGVACEIVELPRGGRAIDEVLTSAARAREATYMVMGAYGHTRLIETIWGGVTRALFAHPPMPLLACH